MNTSERSRLLRLLRGRHDSIVNSWHEAIARTGFTSFTATEMRRHLGELTDQVITALLSEPFERRKARAIGSALAGMHYLSPETLGRAQEVLARRLVEDLPADQIAMLQPRLAVLLAEVAAGFFEQARDIILLEQEQIKAALVDERRQVEEALRQSEASLAEAQRVAHLGHWDYEWLRDRLRWSDEIYRIFGVSKKDFGGTFEDYFKRVHPGDRELVKKAGEEALGGGQVSLEHRIVRPDGEVRLVHHRLQFMFDEGQAPPEGYASGPDDEGYDESKEFLNRILRALSRGPKQPTGRPVRVIGTVQDVTERKALEKRLEYQAFHDGLTGLPNRTLFLDRLEQSLERINRREGKIQVLFLDLDDFKLVNDGLGHAVGDQLLVKVAGRLEACVRPQDTVARFGGDEFTILLQGAIGVGSAVRVAERIIECLQTPFVLGNNEVFVTASIGIASGTFGDLPEDLLRDADVALYRAKARRKASYLVFETSMNDRALEQLRLASDLRRAIERKEFVLHYQPKVELTSGKIVGVEALLRWQHPERGLVQPDEFIPLSEEMGLIVPIGRWVIEEAYRQASFWQEQCLGGPALTVSVNLSARQLQHPKLAQEIAQTLRVSEANPNGLELEITESALMEYEEIVLTKLKELKRLGVRLAIDDFGTGYSSLSHLNRLPIDVLKIDRSFIEGLEKDTKAGLITSATINLAQALRLEVVAEGVETVEQLAQLRKLGCTLAQGNYFSKPLTSEGISALIQIGLLPKLAKGMLRKQLSPEEEVNK